MEKIIYHGSDKVIDKPYYGGGKKSNDFGSGFYCSEDYQLALEWGGYPDKVGHVNSYRLDMDELKVLDLTDSKYSILHWVTILLKNRNCNLRNDIQRSGYKFLLENYDIDLSKYDVVIGWRADDAYFSYTREFVSNSIPIDVLESVMKLGDLGKQIVLISRKAFQHITFIKQDDVRPLFYWVKKELRNLKAVSQYHTICDGITSKQNQKYLIDLIRGRK